MKKENNNNKLEKRLKKGFKIYSTVIGVIGLLTILTPVVHAADNDPITVVNNLSSFIFQLTKVIGGIITGYGIVQFGLSFTSHDASQRSNSLLYIVGGVIIMCAEVILKLIAG